MMTGRQIRRHLHADAVGELRMQIEIRRRVVEAVADLDQLVGVDAVHDVRLGGVLVPQPLELRRKRGAEVHPEPFVFDAGLL